MNKRTILFIFNFAFIVLSGFWLWASPAGEAGDGIAYPASCVDCHGDSPKYPLLGAALEYEASGHKNNGNSHYANGDGCQQCHTNEGFIEYVNTGKVEGYVNAPSQPGCFTCHNPHTTGDFSLRTTEPVKLANGKTFDIGAGNLCASCHQARGTPEELAVPTAANKVTSHWGAHHGPQADILAGTNAYEFAGKTYSNSKHSTLIKDGCSICHMSYPQGRYGLSPEIGGHTFSIVGEVHETETANVSACKSCHQDVSQVRGTEYFNITADKDYDLDGVVEPVQQEVVGLLEAFVNPEGTGYLQQFDPPFYKADGSWNQVSTGALRQTLEMAALYNYLFFLEDRSNGVHNPVYTVQVLYDTLKALDPAFDDSLRP